MKIIARCNGTVLTEADGRLGLVEIGGGWLGTALFVSVLVAGIAAINGAMLLAIGQPLAGAIVLAGAALTTWLAVVFLRKRRRHRDALPGAPWLVFDLGAGVLADAAGRALAPLSQVRVVQSWQMGSSSKALALELPGKKLVIARGTPFGDSVGDLEAALRARLR